MFILIILLGKTLKNGKNFTEETTQLYFGALRNSKINPLKKSQRILITQN